MNSKKDDFEDSWPIFLKNNKFWFGKVIWYKNKKKLKNQDEAPFTILGYVESLEDYNKRKKKKERK